MKNKFLEKAFLVGVPWVILFVMVFAAYLPIWQGSKFLLPVSVYDPRDFFRGNYVDLRYEFSNLKRKDIVVEISHGKTYQFGDTLFLDLAKDADTLHPVGIYDSAEKVKNIALKVQPRTSLTENNTDFWLVSGLESFFAPEKDAKEWEKSLREGKVFAEVSIAPGGSARLTRLVKK